MDEKYYKITGTSVLGGVYDAASPRLSESASWISGAAHAFDIPTPLTIDLLDDFGTRLPEIFDSVALVMSDRLVAALRRAGVDNIDTYPAVLVDRKRGVEFQGYQAVQVIGCIRAADMSRSEYFDPIGYGQMIDFRRLVIDPDAAGGALMFRLYESAATLIIHESVKAELDKNTWSFVTVCPTEVIPLPLVLDDEEGDDDDGDDDDSDDGDGDGDDDDGNADDSDDDDEDDDDDDDDPDGGGGHGGHED